VGSWVKTSPSPFTPSPHLKIDLVSIILSVKVRKMLSKTELNKLYYDSHGTDVQLKRVIKRLEAGNAVRMATLMKYKLYDTTHKRVIIPDEHLTPKMIFSDLAAAAPTKIDVVRQEPPPKVVYYNPNEVCTGDDLLDFLKSPAAMLLPNGKKRTPETLNQYAKIPMEVATINSKPFNKTENIARALNDAPKIIQGYKKLYPKAGQEGTVAKKLNGVLYVIQNCPKLITATHKDAISLYNAESQRLQGANAARLEVKRKSTSIYSWDALCDFILTKYTKYSRENLIMHLYTDIIGRDDFGLPIVHDINQANKPSNYIYLNWDKKEALVHIHDYKTAGAYGDQNIQLSPTTNDILFRVIKPNEKTLFDQKKLGVFIRSMFLKAGLNEPEMGVRYFRRSRVSTELLRLDPTAADYPARRQQLAENAMHSVNTQEKYNYKFKPFPESVGISVPVRQISAKVLKDFDDEIIQVRSRREREIKEPERLNITHHEPKKRAAKPATEFVDYTGRQVKKRFPDKKIYSGIVSRHYKKAKKVAWEVRYDDGDVKSYNTAQLEKILI
jgi:hypothetical protein